ncbi:hypothetical protein AAHA92_11872 [Salvia divinorum]|uniref:Uncharacterized protein n=1 Tax=Salvia divinorum TaxID=28513 RepID=A0ABD1HJR7_SALDI
MFSLLNVNTPPARSFSENSLLFRNSLRLIGKLKLNQLRRFTASLRALFFEERTSPAEVACSGVELLARKVGNGLLQMLIPTYLQLDSYPTCRFFPQGSIAWWMLVLELIGSVLQVPFPVTYYGYFYSQLLGL